MARRRFSLFHVSMLEVEQPTFTTSSNDRVSWLNGVFEHSLRIPYRSDLELVWVPRSKIDDIIFGVVQRTIRRVHHESPEEGGVETVSEEWQGAYILIDPTSHDNGQRIAIENDIVGKPSAIADYIARYLNSLDDRPFNVEIDEIFNKQGFWSFSEDRDHRLRYISFSFVAPNMWRTREGLEEDLRRAREKTNAKKYIMRLGGPDGVRANNDFVEASVDYAAQGGGSVKAGGFDRKTFDSKSQTVVTEIESAVPDSELAEVEIARSVGRVMGYET